ncbi:hypothetical protein LOAG_17553 [Loa loa]|uniref:Uncharacterized protein n=2 Tax=Loa loa TaxID=7209 RepID=A0A1S0UIJ5_LOALO|nr:hypothetical protein LOAG_17553 [Loa loa]EJD75271.1 hypothetical protein LOAG_17553 [Loa loa]
MKDDVDVTDVLHAKVDQMNAEVEKMKQVLQAKEAVLEDVLCSINQLPRHPFNTVLIKNILKSEVKQPESSNLNGFKCCIIWSALFLENICIAIEVENDTHHAVLPSCAAICNCDLSDTITVIFDGLLTTQYIPAESKRTLLVSFRKGLLLSKEIILVLDCDFVTVSDSYSDLAIVSFFSSDIRSKQTRIVNILNFDEPLEKFSLSEMDDLSLKEGMKLYQCLYACHFSMPLNIAPSYLRILIRNIGKFREVDFEMNVMCIVSQKFWMISTRTMRLHDMDLDRSQMNVNIVIEWIINVFEYRNENIQSNDKMAFCKGKLPE